MSDWEQELTDEEREAWDAFVAHVREDAAKKIASSTYVLSLMPRYETDIKYAVELGLAIMYDKPLVVICHPEAKIPRHLQRVADTIIEADIDTEEGREIIAQALTGLDLIQL